MLLIPVNETLDVAEETLVVLIFTKSELAAAKVGGIGFNQEKPAELFYDNLMMGTNLMEEARKNGVKKFIALVTPSFHQPLNL